MNNMKIPLEGVSQEKLFDECVSGFSQKHSNERIARLQGIKQTVVKDSNDYPRIIRENDEDVLRHDLSKHLTNDLIALYEQKFVRKSSPGREYYERIISSPEHNICPLCGVGQVSTLDHYLPKSIFLTLSITPSNLVPSCSDCNETKSSTDKLLVHVYFDTIPNDKPWLFATIMDGNPVAANYHVSCPKSWDYYLVHKIENHFNCLGLSRLYSIKAAEELSSLYPAYRKHLEDYGIDVLSDLLDSFISIERMNSWKYALYRALKTHFCGSVFSSNAGGKGM